MKSNLRNGPGRFDVAADLRLLLQGELARRCASNRQYSLRAFAKFLGVDHSSLSQILRGKRRLTAESVRKLGTRLGLDGKAIDAHVARERARGNEPGAEAAVREVRRLARDTAALIADWQHYAILELIRLRDFRPDSRWLARVLGISTDEINLALHRLLRLGLLEMVSRDQWVDHLGDAAASLEGFARAAVNRFAEQVRKLTLRALESVPDGRCEYSSTTVAVETARVPEAIERLARMREALLTILDQGGDRDDVYLLEITFVPLTRLQCKETDRGPTRDALADRD